MNPRGTPTFKVRRMKRKQLKRLRSMASKIRGKQENVASRYQLTIFLTVFTELHWRGGNKASELGKLVRRLFLFCCINFKVKYS